MINPAPTTKTLICIGSGGVGKTTLSASIAAGLASAGKKVLVLTIDPSQRLAQALGVKTDGNVYEVNLGKQASGRLYSCVINHQKTFDWFVRTAAKSADISILTENRLYQQLSGRLSGSQEFTSLISLHRHVSSGEYDLVILDTPPSQHTWNFLRGPEKIAALFNEGVASWFRNSHGQNPSFIKKVLNIGTTQVLKALESLTGSQFMKELAAFFRAIQDWQEPLEQQVMNCHRLLVSPETEFFLVTALDASRITEAQKLSREILKQGYRLTAMIVNRVPTWTTLAESRSLKSVPPRVQDLVKYFHALENSLSGQLGQFKKIIKVHKCFESKQASEDISSLMANYESIIAVD